MIRNVFWSKLSKLNEQNFNDDKEDGGDVSNAAKENEEVPNGDKEDEEEVSSLEKSRFADMGVKKVSILAIAPKTPENYFNMKLMLQKTKLNTLRDYLLYCQLLQLPH